MISWEIMLKLFLYKFIQLVWSLCHPAHTDEPYLNNLCDMLDKWSDRNSEIYFSGDSNINWLGQSDTNTNKVFPSVSDCHSAQQNKCRQWTRVDYIHANVPDLWSNSIGSVQTVCKVFDIIHFDRKPKLYQIKAHGDCRRAWSFKNKLIN